MTIGERIKQKRQELGLSQEEVADKLGYKSRTSVFKVEQGITDLPLSKVKEFAEVLKTTPAHLTGWEEDEKEKLKKNRRIRSHRSHRRREIIWQKIKTFVPY